MLPSSSSISNSSARLGVGHRRQRWRIAAIVGWTLLALILLDAAVGFVARPPRDPNKAGNGLQVYFGYGTSIEAKLRRQLGAKPGDEAAILRSGWLGDVCDGRPAKPDPQGVSVYGQSFAGHVARNLAMLDPRLHVTIFAGPDAPPSHSYACFLRRDAARIDGNATQVLGILADSVRRMETMSATSTSFEQPEPYTFPRFFLRDGALVKVDPTITDVAGLRRTLQSHARWRAYIDTLTRTDRFASPLLANHDVIDGSVVLKMLRRAWGQRFLQDRTAALRGPTGAFEGDPALVPTMRAIAIDFARRVRARGQHPVILLFENRGYDRALRDTLVPTLRANGIPYVLSADIAPATDSGIFLPDGHFLPSIDRKIAEAALPLVDRPAR